MQVERDFPSGDESGARVRNAYATCLIQGDSPWKRGLISHRIIISHGIMIKTEVV